MLKRREGALVNLFKVLPPRRQATGPWQCTPGRHAPATCTHLTVLPALPSRCGCDRPPAPPAPNRPTSQTLDTASVQRPLYSVGEKGLVAPRRDLTRVDATLPRPASLASLRQWCMGSKLPRPVLGPVLSPDPAPNNNLVFCNMGALNLAPPRAQQVRQKSPTRLSRHRQTGNDLPPRTVHPRARRGLVGSVVGRTSERE